jgi:transcriptional regulator with XRE-family HTH domain
MAMRDPWYVAGAYELSRNDDGADIKVTPKTCQEKYSVVAKSQTGRDFGERLKEAFGGDNQATIAGKLGISDASVSAYIKGESLPNLDNLKKISALTKCSLHWLLTGEGEADRDPFRFLTETERQIVQKIADGSKENFEETLHRLIVDALIAYGQHLFGQYRTMGANDLEQLQLLFKLYEADEEEEQTAKTSAESKRRA